MENKNYEGKHRSLMDQVNKISRHNRQGSFKTRERYASAVNNFTRHLANNFGVQKFANISDKHVESYVNEMKANDLSVSTIKTNLAAIRFYHDKAGNTRNRISPNERFDLGKRDFIGSDKSWSSEEVDRFKEFANMRQNALVHDTVTLARNEGLRIHEALRIDRSIALNALRTGELTIKGKGGKVRSVPLTEESRNILSDRVSHTEVGEKLFIGSDEKTHLVIKQVQNFISRNQSECVGPERAERLSNGENVSERVTFHGLRHSYAQEQYESFKAQGASDYQARLFVSRLLGHERDEVTRIYLAK